MNILYDFEPAEHPQGKAVPSPCVGVCRMDQEKGWCAGCFRTIDELTGWSKASDQHKLVVWHQVKQRMF